MSQRRGFMCPECKTDVVGTLLDDGALRCDWRLLGWRSTLVGKDKNGKDEYDYIPQTETGCGGLLRLCAHGLRVCAGVPPCPNFTKATAPHNVALTLADLMRADAERLVAKRELDHLGRKARAYTPPKIQEAPTEKAPTRVQLPFLGDSEPTRWTPPRSRKKKGTQ